MRDSRTPSDNLSLAVLAAHASKHGSTAEVAADVAATLRAHGLAVDVRPAAEVAGPTGYDAVVLGGARGPSGSPRCSPSPRTPSRSNFALASVVLRMRRPAAGPTMAPHPRDEGGGVSTIDLKLELDREEVPYELIPHRRTTTAGEEASALGVSPDEVAKTIVLTTVDGFLRAVLPASERLDLDKVRARLLHPRARPPGDRGRARRRLPDVRARRGAARGRPRRDRTIVDRKLAMLDSVVIEAGSHDESVWIAVKDLLLLAEAEIADICEERGAER